ncbi:MAG: hypothetical protein M3164_01860, partial [Actinomycetota bacterium]|nr:hypothetical protein [Actinomycetota bacterium]
MRTHSLTPGPHRTHSPTPGPDPEEMRYPRRVRWLALSFLVLIWLSFTFPVLSGKVRFPADLAQSAANANGRKEPASNPIDADSYFASYPWHEYLGDRLRAGDLPLWDPHRFIGVPYAANPSMGSWYPPNWLYSTGQT